METTIVTDKDQPNVTGLDVSCNLGSIDIHQAAHTPDFETKVDTAMRLLTSVSDMTNIVNVPSVARANELMHSVGLGAMNLHGHLVTENLEYGSEEAVSFTSYCFEALDYFSLKSSVKIAEETGETFYGYEGSDYQTGKYIARKLGNRPALTEKVKKALGQIPVITDQMWKDLQEEIDQYGVYHSYRLAVAPTGSISYIRSCTPSIAPITEIVEVRDYADSRTIYPMPFLTNENAHLYKDAYNTDMFRMIDMYAAAQKHVDQGISMTLYVTDQWTTEKLAKVYIYAQEKGIKSVYYVRQRLQTIEECISCQI